MNRFFRHGLTAAACGVLVCGCEMLPSGEPPAGPIVENPVSAEQERAALSLEKARERAIAELIPVTLLHCPGEEIAVDADAATAGIAAEILDECGKLSGVRCAGSKEAEYRLISRLQSGNSCWQLSLVTEKNKVLWKSVLRIKAALRPEKTVPRGK